MEATQKERDGLKAKVNDLSASLEHVKAKLAASPRPRTSSQAAAEQATTLKDQLTQVTQDRDSALAKLADARAMVEKLKSQVQEQIPKVAAL